jgi:homocitrate synthase NifV
MQSKPEEHSMKANLTESDKCGARNHGRRGSERCVKPKKPPALIDTTLRDGAQAADVVLNHDSRIRIAEELFSCGITEIEAGMPAMGPEEQRTIKSIVQTVPEARIIGWCRAHESDLRAASQCGCDTIHISFPVSDIHLRCLNLREQWVEKNIPALIKKALDLAKCVTIGFQDASRAPIDRLARFAAMAAECGARRIRIADTVGIFAPLECAQLIRTLAAQLAPMELEFHGHNDLGMATANTITAIKSGATAASVTINGIGERSGNASLEEVAAALMSESPWHASGLRMERIVALCNFIARITKEPIPKSKPITGKNAFRHEAGIHSRALLRDARAYEPFPPKLLGRLPSSIVAGTHSGSSGVQAMLAESGVSIDRRMAAEMQPVIREKALKTGRSLDHRDVFALYNEKFRNTATVKKPVTMENTTSDAYIENLRKIRSEELLT